MYSGGNHRIKNIFEQNDAKYHLVDIQTAEEVSKVKVSPWILALVSKMTIHWFFIAFHSWYH